MCCYTIIPRHEVHNEIMRGFKEWPITIVYGPSQCGKTYLVKGLSYSKGSYFDLFSYIDYINISDLNFRMLDNQNSIVVIDNIDDRIDILSLFHRMIDIAEYNPRTRFVLTTSDAVSYISDIVGKLSVPVRFLELSGVSLSEVGFLKWETLWLQGGFPMSFLLYLDDSIAWRDRYIKRMLSFICQYYPYTSKSEYEFNSKLLRRFFLLLAHHHGQLWDHKKVASILEIDRKTVRRYLDIFKRNGIIRELPSFSLNSFKKRSHKLSRIYIRDSGLLNSILNIRNLWDLYSSVQLKYCWIGFGIEQVITMMKLREENCFSWTLRDGSFVDLLFHVNNRLIGVMFKAGDAPRGDRFSEKTVDLLNLHKLFIVYPGDKDYSLGDKTQVISIKNLDNIKKFCAD